MGMSVRVGEYERWLSENMSGCVGSGYERSDDGVVMKTCVYMCVCAHLFVLNYLWLQGSNHSSWPHLFNDCY